jgi:hypothetical protein
MFGSVVGVASPGFRFRAIWTHVGLAGSVWIPNFFSPDWNENHEQQILTFDILAIPDRSPGTSGRTYTVLYYPQQYEKLMSTDAIVYVAADLMDLDSISMTDHGMLSVADVVVDGIGHPAIGSGTAVPAWTTTNFTSWARNVKNLSSGAPTTAGLIATAGATNITVTVQPGNAFLEAAFSSAGARMDVSRYYRAAFYCTSTASGSVYAPNVRPGFTSSRLIWVAQEDLAGGGVYSKLGAQPKVIEVWGTPPTAEPPSTAESEEMSLRWESYVIGPTHQVFGNNIYGTVRCTKVQGESFPAVP